MTRPFTQDSMTDEVADLAKRAMEAGPDAIGMTVAALIAAVEILAEAHDAMDSPKRRR